MKAVENYSVPLKDAPLHVDKALQKDLETKNRIQEYNDATKKRQFRYHPEENIIRGNDYFLQIQDEGEANGQA